MNEDIIKRNMNLTDAVAALLGKEWGRVLHETDRRYWTTLVGPNAAVLKLRWDGCHNEGRVQISGSYPTGPNGGSGVSYLGYKVENPSATVDYSRGPKAIVSAIKGRVLKNYIPLLMGVLTRQRREAERKRQCVEAEKRIAEALPGQLLSTQQHRPGGGFEFGVYHPTYWATSIVRSWDDSITVDLEISCLSVDGAVALLRLLGSLHPKDRP